MKCVQSLFVSFFAGLLTSSAFALDVYVETNYKNQPDMRPYGVKKVGPDPFKSGMIYEGNLWSKGQSKSLLPSQSRVTNFVKDKFGVDYNGLLVIDLETWPIKGGSDVIFKGYLDRYLTLLGWVQSAAPTAKVGYYGKPPISNPSAAQQDEDEKLYTDWRAKNDRIAPLADAVDAFFPSLYATNDSRTHWVNYAAAMIKETKRYGTNKKIYPHINPEYHSSARKGLAFKLIPEDYFLLQLQTLKQQKADGVIIWAWGSQNTPWNANLPWWRATLTFLGSR
ncbi:MAG: hypothetical protein ACREYF_26805 [Gammaproteobacteria bacterium]